MFNYDVDQEPSFFDSEEEREAKRKQLSALSDEEKTEMEQIKKSMELIPNVNPEEAEGEDGIDVVWDEIPSLFDNEKTYCAKLHALEIYGWPEKFKPVNEVKLIAGEETVACTSVTMLANNNTPIVCIDTEELRAQNFVYAEGSLHYVYNKGRGEHYIGNIGIKILAELRYIFENVNEQNVVIDRTDNVQWLVEVLCMGEKFTAEIGVKELLSETEVLKITKDRGYLEPEKESKKLYKKYINTIIAMKNYPKRSYYNATGWFKDDKGMYIYITDKGVIGHPELPIFAKVPYRFDCDSSIVGTKETFNGFFGMKNICAKKIANSTFLMHYTCLAVMTTLFQEAGHGVNFVTALIGATNSQKTSTAIVFSRLFDRTAKAVADIRFNSTEVAIMEKMETYGDAILLVDDFLPYADARSMNEQRRKSETIIRSYGDRVPRKRSKEYAQRTGSQEYSRVKGCCIITGEVFDVNSESSATRVIKLNFEPGDVDLALLTYYQQNLNILPAFLYDFICFLEENIEFVFESIMSEVASVRNCYELPISIPRFRDTLGIMAAETRIFYAYAIARGFLSKAEASAYREADMKMFLSLIINNEVNSKVIGPDVFICRALKRAMEKNAICCLEFNDCKEMSSFEDKAMETDEYLYILPDTLWTIYVAYCKETGRDVMYKNGRELATPLKNGDVILLKPEGEIMRSAHKLNVRSSKRFFYIKKSDFNKKCEIYEKY